MNRILFADPCKYHEISKEDSKWILSKTQDSIVLIIRNYIDLNKSKKVTLSQHALLILGMYGDLKDTSIISIALKSEIACSQELPPCEYYCAYNTANTLLKIRFQNEIPQSIPSWPQWPKNLSVKSIQSELIKFPEEIIAQSLLDSSMKVNLPSEVDNKLTDSQKEPFYEFSVYYDLFERGHSKSTIKLLLERLLYLYGRDASGDGGVSDLEKVIFKITYKSISK